MTSPADKIREEVSNLMNIHVLEFGRKTRLDDHQLQDHFHRSEQIKKLYSQLDGLSAQNVRESGWKAA
jgi:hypothetical protein